MIEYIEEYNLSQAKNNIIKHAKLDWSDQSEPYSSKFNDIYFNNQDGLKESQYVFFEGNHLQQRWQAFSKAHFCIIETGFGSGLNFINTLQHFLQFKLMHPNHPLQRLHFISFELFPLNVDDLKKTLNNFPQFNSIKHDLIEQYPLPLTGCHRLLFNDGEVLLDLWFGDINDQIDNLSSDIADAWYLDGFDPSKNPQMWHIELFKKMQLLSKKQATLATFTAAGFVRRGLTQAGFTIKKRKGYGNKREMLTGCIDVVSDSKDDDDLDANRESVDVAIIGGGIAALCSALSLAKRGNKVSIYCKDEQLGVGASGNLQGALYPLLNQHHNELSQLFSNAYLYALNFYRSVARKTPFPHQFNGLLQLAYDESSAQKLQKIIDACLPSDLVHWVEKKQTNNLAGVDVELPALFYPFGGWLSPRELILSLTQQLNQYANVDIQCNHEIQTLIKPSDTKGKWALIAKPNNLKPRLFHHKSVIIAAGFETINFEQCHAIPLSAARGQVSHIKTKPLISSLKRTLCHEGYITPSYQEKHCVGATFKRHDNNTEYRQSEQNENIDKLKKCINNKSWINEIKVSAEAHTAIRCTTRDHFPYVGELTDYNQLKADYGQMEPSEIMSKSLPDIYVLTGLGSRGLCSGPLLAEIIASKINNESIPISEKIMKKMQIPRQWLSYINKNKPLKV
jgi:tRNA 5-methylaminomethyl-2-thiouridine biosynthesis bifunctional protein